MTAHGLRLGREDYTENYKQGSRDKNLRDLGEIPIDLWTLRDPTAQRFYIRFSFSLR
jgi:hypothetical protein